MSADSMCKWRIRIMGRPFQINIVSRCLQSEEFIHRIDQVGDIVLNLLDDEEYEQFKELMSAAETLTGPMNFNLIALSK